MKEVTLASVNKSVLDLSGTVKDLSKTVTGLSDRVVDISNKVKDLSKTVADLSRTVSNLSITVEGHSNTLEFLINKVLEHDKRFEVLEERTAYIPKIYDHIDKFISEIKENREERIIMNYRLNDHESRIGKLETGK